MEDEWMETQEDRDFLEWLGERIAKEEQGVFLSVPERISQVSNVCGALKAAVHRNGVKTTVHVHEPLVSMGSVSFSGSGVVIDRPALLAQAARLGGILEVYPRVDGTVVMDVTFHGLAVKIGE